MIRRIAALSLAAGLLPGLALVDVGTASAATPTPVYSNGKPHNARLTIPAIGIHRLKIVAYYGKTDDGRGTKIQNRGIAASSHGAEGGVGPGGIGNYQVAAHRSSHGAVFRRTPSLHRGNRVFVDMNGLRFIYRIVQTRRVDFRSPASLRAQRAAVPGHPGATPTKAYITISTCATPEDHAQGNFWSDRYGNPQHRIDKIGILVNTIHVPKKYRR